MEIKTLIANRNNYGSSRDTSDIKYIVIHYTGNNGDKAVSNAKYFHNNNVGVSAHYFIDENEIYQSVQDDYIAWHCGAKTYKHLKCRNNNSIGVEHCSYMKNGKWYFKEATIEKSIELVAELMKKYNIPISNVVRHADVTGKSCPQPFLYNNADWNNYLSKVESKYKELTEPKLNKTEPTVGTNQIDQELYDAVSKIIKSGISIEFNSWKRIDLIKLSNVPFLLNKLGGIDKLVKDKVISDGTLWKTGKYNVNHVRSLLIKYAKTLK